jgi:hypothetical protein
MEERIKKVPRKASYKDTSGDAFAIKFSYQGIEVERTVHDNMPMRVLFALARG